MIVPHDPLDLLVVAFAGLYLALVAPSVYTRHALRRRRAWGEGRSRPLRRRLGGPR